MELANYADASAVERSKPQAEAIQVASQLAPNVMMKERPLLSRFTAK